MLHSAGLDAGGDAGFAHIYLNGEDVISGRRGINLAVIEPRTGGLEATAHFDTHGDQGAAGRLLELVRSVPEGRIVAVAVISAAGTTAVKCIESTKVVVRWMGRMVAPVDGSGCCPAWMALVANRMQ